MMNKINNYETMVEAVEALQAMGYTSNFSISENGVLVEAGNTESYLPSKIELHEMHRFEGNTNPSDMSILYAIETNSGKKGIVVDAFGVDGSEAVSKFMNKVGETQYNANKQKFK